MPPAYDTVSEANEDGETVSRQISPPIRSRLLGGCIIIVSLSILTAAVVYTCFSNVDKSPEFDSECGKPGPLFLGLTRHVDTDVWPAHDHQYPFYSLFFTVSDRIPFCAGVVVAHHWILTSAHCVIKRREQLSSFRVASGLRHKSSLQPASRSVTKVIVHDSYNYPDATNDIALVKVTSHAVAFDLYASAICLEADKRNDTRDYLIAGFGTTSDHKPGKPDISMDDLRATNVNLLDDDACKKHFGDNYDQHMMCVHHWNSTSTKKHIGDSGGPLFHTNQSNVTTLIALNTCDAQGKFGLYLRVSDYYKWIFDTINEQ